MSELNINNLVLDDNSFEVIPDGDYHFTVAKHEIGFAESDKIPANTQQVRCYLEIPYKKDGEIKIAKVRNNLNIYQKALFAIRQFTDCIGLTPEKGKATLNLEDMDGRSGVCSITTRESKNGNEFNNVAVFYAPSKAPAVTLNDEAWKEYDPLDISFDDI
jgi:hypothetical protein